MAWCSMRTVLDAAAMASSGQHPTHRTPPLRAVIIITPLRIFRGWSRAARAKRPLHHPGDRDPKLPMRTGAHHHQPARQSFRWQCRGAAQATGQRWHQCPSRGEDWCQIGPAWARHRHRIGLPSRSLRKANGAIGAIGIGVFLVKSPHPAGSGAFRTPMFMVCSFMSLAADPSATRPAFMGTAGRSPCITRNHPKSCTFEVSFVGRENQTTDLPSKNNDLSR